MYKLMSSIFLTTTFFSSTTHAVTLELDLDRRHTLQISQKGENSGYFKLDRESRFPSVEYNRESHTLILSRVTEDTLRSSGLEITEENENLVFNLRVTTVPVTTGKHESENTYFYGFKISLPYSVVSTEETIKCTPTSITHSAPYSKHLNTLK